MKTRFNPRKHHRKSIRLKDYDYASEGAYFVTIVTQERECNLGSIVSGEMHLSLYGEMVQKWWKTIPVHFANVKTGAFVIMPNHVHGIIFITDGRRGEVLSPGKNPNHSNENGFIEQYIRESWNGETSAARKPTLGQIIAYFKYQSTKEINVAAGTGAITKLWQRNYYEHVIRNEKELKQKTDYILSNLSRWEGDQENPRNKKSPGG